MLELAIALQHLPFLNSAERLQLMELYSGLDDLRRITARDMLQAVGRPYRGQEFDPEVLIQRVYRQQDWMDAAGIHALHIWSSAYPALLREMDHPPVVLYVRGELPQGPCISVVGTRHPTSEGRHAAYRVGFELVRLGYCVVSGLAMGIDAAAHEGALGGGGITAAVLGSGVDRIYPRGNLQLASRLLAQDGALISEFPPGTMPAKRRFPLRNRVIAGLSALTVIVEAPRNSGALITADFAAGKREVLVHQAGCDSVLGDGCRELVLNGVKVIRGRAAELIPAAHREGADEYRDD
ncbi:DNA-processing protein DprA [Spirochaeta africana]|uniref:DNA protecting protein DprA n=1 Tax=Spirochaeta africana (strain ATCC 700263 / DSM 8902 / Z-7692) TaxID=889378 RepID=H9UKW7_SPIAZ|nr:DNA-processing protein DprA [Spirochaeta africana]AFG38160.1 DNA protecting protein DprA [Spirochaeta africana DSM 8902]